MRTNSTATKLAISMFLETEEGKDMMVRMKSYKNHCIDEKMSFYKMVKDNPELLSIGDNKLRYHCYIDDVIGVLAENITSGYSDNLKNKQIKEKYDRIVNK